VTTLKTVRNLVKLVIISEMGVTTKEGNGSVPSHTTDGLEDGIKLGRVRDGDVTSNNEKVDILVTNGVLEPLLLDSVLYPLNNSIVRITLEVEEEAKSHNSDTLIFRSELSESLCKRLQFSGFWVVDVQVGSNVSLLEVWYSVIVFIIGRVLLIEFMVARSDDVYLLMFENVKGIMSFGIGGVVETVAFYTVASIYDEKVTAVFIGFLAEVMGKRDVISPISRVLGSVSVCQISSVKTTREADSLLQVAAMPSMCICCRQEIQLTPRKLSQRSFYSFRGRRLGSQSHR
jgi:hypothetical protein